jgi:glycine/D-amino acid oxidase-like deaminating enzyme
MGLGCLPLTTGKGMSTNSRLQDKLHVAVVGAGAFGVWTALHLLRKGVRVTLLDAWGPGNSRSSSGGETRVIRSVYGPDRIYVQWVKRSFELWKENQSRLKTDLYHQTGLLWMFRGDDAYAKQSLPIVNDLGFRVEPLASAEARRRYPQINFDKITSLYYEFEAGYLMARRACQVVSARFREEGGSYRQAAVKLGPIRSQAMQDILLSDGTHLVADRYVFACGPWLGQLLPDILAKRIQPTRQDVFFFGTPAGDDSFHASNMPVWVDFGERLVYGIPGNEHRGFKVADDTRGQPFDPSDGDRTPSQEALGKARDFLALRFPRLRTAPLLESRVCQYENSPDGHLVIDQHPEARNVWLAGGGSGHGFKLSPALGEYLTGQILGAAPFEPFFALKRLSTPSKSKTQFEKSK